MIMLFILLFTCLRVVTVNPSRITSDDLGQVGFIIELELTKFSADVLRAAASGQLSESRTHIWLRRGACPILPSEPVGMFHNQFPPPQQCRERSDIDPDGRALEFVEQFQELCSLWIFLCVIVN
jgi:hypothetical protein